MNRRRPRSRTPPRYREQQGRYEYPQHEYEYQESGSHQRRHQQHRGYDAYVNCPPHFGFYAHAPQPNIVDRLVSSFVPLSISSHADTYLERAGSGQVYTDGYPQVSYQPPRRYGHSSRFGNLSQSSGYRDHQDANDSERGNHRITRQRTTVHGPVSSYGSQFKHRQYSQGHASSTATDLSLSGGEGPSGGKARTPRTNTDNMTLIEKQDAFRATQLRAHYDREPKDLYENIRAR